MIHAITLRGQTIATNRSQPLSPQAILNNATQLSLYVTILQTQCPGYSFAFNHQVHTDSKFDNEEARGTRSYLSPYSKYR